MNWAVRRHPSWAQAPASSLCNDPRGTWGPKRPPRAAVFLTALGALLCPCPLSCLLLTGCSRDSYQITPSQLLRFISWFCRLLERKDHQQTWAKSPKAKRRRKRRILMSPKSQCQPTPCFSETHKQPSKGKTPMLLLETYRKLLHQCGTVWEKNKNK